MRFESKKDQNEEKMKKHVFCNSKKRIFITALLWLVSWLCISKMICRAQEGALITF
jgi:hypothetical protein